MMNHSDPSFAPDDNFSICSDKFNDKHSDLQYLIFYIHRLEERHAENAKICQCLVIKQAILP